MINQLQAHFYFCEGEQMPEPILNSSGELDIEADNAQLEAWSNGSDYNTFRDADDVEYFLEGVQNLVFDLQTLQPSDEQEIQSIFYEHAKLTFGEDKSSIRQFFAMLYLLLFNKNHGPRWGQFVSILGIEEFVDMVENRLYNLR